MRLGRPVPRIVLTADERETLERWARRPTTAQALALRARLVLRCAGGESATATAHDVHVTKQTVGKWRSRFLARRLDGLLDEPRPGVPRKITDADVERVLTTTLESTPRDATHWSTRSLGEFSSFWIARVKRNSRSARSQSSRSYPCWRPRASKISYARRAISSCVGDLRCIPKSRLAP